jgi:alpha-D-ribose 1-methylphosphonate 5-triphosphate diphosphatase PhnM
MREVFENALSWLSVEMEGTWTRRHPALPFAEALAGAVALTSANPARLFGERRRGILEPGARADAVLADIGGGPGAYAVRVKGAWVAGARADA